jgi:hypothetical protein
MSFEYLLAALLKGSQLLNSTIKTDLIADTPVLVED